MISLVLLTVGLALLVMGVRFMMVRNSLLAGKPSEKRLGQLKKEFMVCFIVGIIVYLIGWFSPRFPLSIEQAKAIASVGVMLVGLSIPQYLQRLKGRGDEQQVKRSAQQIKKWGWGLAILGAVLVVASPILNV